MLIARRGGLELHIKPGVDPTAKDAKGTIKNTMSGVESSPIHIQVILKQGYWQPAEVGSAANVKVKRGK